MSAKNEINIPIDVKKFLQLLINHLPMKVFWKDKDSIYEGSNRAFAEFAGLNEDESIIGKTDYDLPWAETKADEFRLYDRSIMDMNEKEMNYVSKITNSEGMEFWTKTTKIPIENENGEVVGVLGFLQEKNIIPPAK